MRLATNFVVDRGKPAATPKVALNFMRYLVPMRSVAADKSQTLSTVSLGDGVSTRPEPKQRRDLQCLTPILPF